MSKQIDPLVSTLRDLRSRLDRCAGPPTGSAAALPLVTRALIATRLLRQHAGRVGAREDSVWLDALHDLLESFPALPATEVAPWEEVLAGIVSHLEDILERLDGGAALQSVMTDREITSLRDSLTGGGQPGPLRERWLKVRALCDRLLTSTVTGRSEQDARSARRVLMLLASSFRARHLRQTLTEAGFTVFACAGPEEAAARLGGESPFAAVVCDDCEPSRNLRRLMALLDFPAAAQPPVVLVSGGRPSSNEQRARRLGVQGAWGPPFLARDFRSLLRAGAPE